MSKRNDENIFFDDEEDEDIEDPVAIREGSDEEESEDDEEANEDLSLKILEKALSRRDSDDSKETSMSDLYGSGVVSTVMVNGEKSKGNNKMKKRTNLEDEEIVSMNDSLPLITVSINVLLPLYVKISNFAICFGESLMLLFNACRFFP